VPACVSYICFMCIDKLVVNCNLFVFVFLCCICCLNAKCQPHMKLQPFTFLNCIEKLVFNCNLFVFVFLCCLCGQNAKCRPHMKLQPFTMILLCVYTHAQSDSLLHERCHAIVLTAIVKLHKSSCVFQAARLEAVDAVAVCIGCFQLFTYIYIYIYICKCMQLNTCSLCI